jgi:hypothetical protein
VPPADTDRRRLVVRAELVEAPEPMRTTEAAQDRPMRASIYSMIRRRS